MVEITRRRIKEQFPTVALTLLSIVQAIALELLWGHVTGADHLFTWSLIAAIGWVQCLATFFGLVLIWVVYAGNLMRFRWVPTTSDSVYPFVIGIGEFWLVEALDPSHIGWWYVALALVIGLMTYVSQISMRQARFDDDNQEFFDRTSPAELKDFAPQAGLVIVLAAVGGLFLWSPGLHVLQLLCCVGVSCFLAWQFHNSVHYWQAATNPK